jgi:tetratricopeptide (TPR) repeat protein
MPPGSETIDEANTAFQNQNYRDAELLLEVINGDPDQRSLRSLLMYALTLEAQNRILEAEFAFQAAEEHAEETADKTNILNKLADLLYRNQGRSDEDLERALEYLEQSLSLDSGATNAAGWQSICAVLFALRNYEAVIEHAESWLATGESGVAARLYFADACFSLGRVECGHDYLDQLENMLEEMGEKELVWLLGVLINYGRLEKAQEVINHAASIVGNAYILRGYQARVHYEANDYDTALSILTDGFIRSIGDSDFARTQYFFRGRCLAALKQYSAAQECFESMNRLAAHLYPKDDSGNVVAHYSGVRIDDLPMYSGLDEAPYAPVFMVGFPRSGTTLLEAVLGTQEHIETLSETDSIDGAINSFSKLGKKYPDDLSKLTRQEVGELRQGYFDHNRTYFPDDTNISILIDKMPLNLLHIPLIVTMFPEARFILSLRHPVDVALSCFQQSFVLNSEMVYFTVLEGCFARYRDVMDLFERFRSELDLRLHTVRYEDLVTDLDGVGRRTFDFLGIQPNESFKDFHRIAKEKSVRTPSRDQVIKPIYDSSRYRWKHYASQVAPYIPLVQPFIDRYGYESKHR